MDIPAVSVVIPLYNTRDYIRETLQSVMKQSLREGMEIIVVDDGSTDGGGDIVREMATGDSRVRLVRQENQGLSGARNTGLKEASGRYVYFMDSDDLLEADAMEMCLCKCEAGALDLVLFDADVFGEGAYCTDPEFYHRTAKLEDRVYSGVELLNVLLDARAHRSSVCLNFFRREFLLEKGLRFYPGMLHEDELFTVLCYLQASRAGIVKRAFFKRRYRAGSIMTSRVSMRNMDGYFTVERELLLFAGRNNGEIRRAVDRFLGRLMGPAVSKAYAMPLGQRLKVAARYLRHLRYVKPRALAVLLFKRPVDKLRGRR